MSGEEKGNKKGRRPRDSVLPVVKGSVCAVPVTKVAGF